MAYQFGSSGHRNLKWKKSNSVIEFEYIDKSENASPTNGIEQQYKRSNLKLDIAASPQASVDDLYKLEELRPKLSSEARVAITDDELRQPPILDYVL